MIGSVALVVRLDRVGRGSVLVRAMTGGGGAGTGSGVPSEIVISGRGPVGGGVHGAIVDILRSGPLWVRGVDGTGSGIGWVCVRVRVRCASGVVVDGGTRIDGSRIVLWLAIGIGIGIALFDAVVIGGWVEPDGRAGAAGIAVTGATGVGIAGSGTDGDATTCTPGAGAAGGTGSRPGGNLRAAATSPLTGFAIGADLDSGTGLTTGADFASATGAGTGSGTASGTGNGTGTGTGSAAAGSVATSTAGSAGLAAMIPVSVASPLAARAARNFENISALCGVSFLIPMR